MQRSVILPIKIYSSRVYSTVSNSLSNINPIHNEKDLIFMKLALRQAQHAYREKEVPVGAVIVDEMENVIATARNRVEETNDATAHAEITCLQLASKIKDNWRLQNCTIYTTLEPCSMCMSAIQSFRIKRLVYGAKDVRLGACGSFIDLVHPFHEVETCGGLLSEESSTLLRSFFRSRRNNTLDDQLRGFSEHAESL